MDVTVRTATNRDIPRLVEVSRSADGMFTEAGLDLPPDDPTIEFRTADWLIVTDVPEASSRIVVGFATLVEVGGQAHLTGLGVHRDHMRRGVGSTLLTEAQRQARARGYEFMTLTTFRDLPFNAPWYERRGFSVLDPQSWGPALSERFRLEDEGSGRAAPRVAMRRAL